MRTTSKLMMSLATLFATLDIAAQDWDAPVPAASSITDEVPIYLYLAEGDSFVAEGSALEAQLSATGFVVTPHLQPNGDYQLMIDGGSYLYFEEDYVGTDGTAYDEHINWCFERQSSGRYLVRPSKTDATMGWDSHPDQWTGASKADPTKLLPLVPAADGYCEWMVVGLNDYALFLVKRQLHGCMLEAREYGVDYAAALAVYNDDGSTAADMQAAIDVLEPLLFDGRVKNASREKPVDVTRWIANPGFTEGWAEGSSDIVGWTLQPEGCMSYSSWEQNCVFTDNTSVGSWAERAFSDRKLYQVMTGLPAGRYLLNMYAINIRHTGDEGDPISGAWLYASNGKHYAQTPMTDSGWWCEPTSLEFEYRSGDLELGTHYANTNVGQCIIDDVQLFYLGYEPVADRLQQLADSARTLIAQDRANIFYINQLQDLVDKAAKAVAADSGQPEQEQLYDDLFDAIVAANENVEAYRQLSRLLDECFLIIVYGALDVKEIDALGEYIDEKGLEFELENKSYTTEELRDIMARLTLLLAEAKNASIMPGDDLTDRLANAHFDTTGGWNVIQGNVDFDPTCQVVDIWWSDYQFEQTLMGLPNGDYKLQAQGFHWTSWDWDQADADWAADPQAQADAVTAVMYMNADQQQLKNLFSVGPTDIREGFYGNQCGYYVPNSNTTARMFFDAGYYENFLTTTVTDHQLTIGFRSPHSSFWTELANVRLTYLGVGTGISDVSRSATHSQRCFNLQGMQVDPHTWHGIYIRNGRKINAR